MDSLPPSHVFPVVKNPPANIGAGGDVSLIPGLGRLPGVENGNPLQYSCLENPRDRGAWWATVHGVTWVRQDWTTKQTKKTRIYFDSYSTYILWQWISYLSWRQIQEGISMKRPSCTKECFQHWELTYKIIKTKTHHPNFDSSRIQSGYCRDPENEAVKQHLAHERIPEGPHLHCMGCWPSELGCRRTPTGWLVSLPGKGCCSRAGRLGRQGLQPQRLGAGCWGPPGQKHRPGGSAWSGAPPRWTAGAGCTGRPGRASLDTSPAPPTTAWAHQPGGQDQTTAGETAKWRITLLSYKKERNWVICRDVRGPRVCHTEGSQSEREKQILHTNAYKWNLENGTDEAICRAGDKEQTWTYRGGEGRMNWESTTDTYTLSCVIERASGKLL